MEYLPPRLMAICAPKFLYFLCEYEESLNLYIYIYNDNI